MDETACIYVGSYGLLKNTTHRSPNPISDFDGLNPEWYSNLSPHSILHVCPQALPSFVNKVLPNINVPFKLLTNNSDCTIPDDFSSESNVILSHPLLETWFAQNCVLSHEKLLRVPIGIDYHSLRPTRRKNLPWEKPERISWGIKKNPLEQEQELLNIKSKAKPFAQREIKGYANFHFMMMTRYGKTDRVDAFNTLSSDIVFYEPRHTTRDVCWSNMTRCAFVISPHGNGLDCHRTWEALCLGCIPIVKSSGIDPLFDELPVWIVDDWKDVSLETMKQKIDEFKDKTFNYQKLTLAYWKSKIINT